MGLFRQHKAEQERSGLRLADAYSVARHTHGARLVHADPPWQYTNAAATGLNGVTGHHYDVITPAEIARDLNAAFDSAAPDAYLLLWITWPILAEELGRLANGKGAIFPGLKWRSLSGGSWHKTSGMGVGYHWRGNSEPLLLLSKGKPKPLYKALSNAHAGPRSRHSEKPEPYLRELIAGFTAPGDLVLDLYAGLAPMRRACSATGRRYVGAEIDPERHAAALATT